MLDRARTYYDLMENRRSVRHFSPDPVPRKLIELAIATASTAPSGAHRQPWSFVAVSEPQIKREIRMAAEAEERTSYEGGRMPPEWLEALAPLGTDWHKPYLETVPWIVVVFEQIHGVAPDGHAIKNYYVKESVGIACGLFVAAIQNMGLATLTHTPSPWDSCRTSSTGPVMKTPSSCFPLGTRPMTPSCRSCAASPLTTSLPGIRLMMINEGSEIAVRFIQDPPLPDELDVQLRNRLAHISTAQHDHGASSYRVSARSARYASSRVFYIPNDVRSRSGISFPY
ncbi:MAG: nitroreductase family protein [Fuerstiella sp.]